VGSRQIADVGVAGLWRLMARLEDIRSYPVVVVIAGMEGALFSVLAGLVSAPMIAVPTSTGYGVSSAGQLALHSALGSCAPGVVAVNIDNGFGAAQAALRIVNSLRKAESASRPPSSSAPRPGELERPEISCADS
jgi:NCAIR mutase (PurE)-related protein